LEVVTSKSNEKATHAPPAAASTDTSVALDLGYTFPDASSHNNGNVTTVTNNIASHRSQTSLTTRSIA